MFVRRLFQQSFHRRLSRLDRRMSHGAPVEVVKTEVFDDDIFTICINRPEKRNCVNSATAKQLYEAFQTFETTQEYKVAVLYGANGCFCAGYDLSEVANGISDFNDVDWSKFRPMGPSMMPLSKPVIAAVQGYAVAGGLELACMCDMRVVEETAIMGVFCRRFGVPLIDGGTIRLPKLIGLSRAMDMILTGRPISGKIAFEWGLANRLVASGSALGQAIQLARSIRQFPQECLKADRRSAYHSCHNTNSFEEAFQFELENGLPIVKQESVAGADMFSNQKLGRHGSHVKSDMVPSKL